MTTISRDVHHDIVELLNRYATGIDSRNWTLFRSCFTDDCVVDYGAIEVPSGADGVTAWMEQAHRDMGHTLHRMSNYVINAMGNADSVTARSYVDALLTIDSATTTEGIGYYDDVIVRDGNAWKIASRTFTMVLFRPNVLAGTVS
jgi:3-phenylpropionate/cinnamic acid dioxygenase small subunit